MEGMGEEMIGQDYMVNDIGVTEGQYQQLQLIDQLAKSGVISSKDAKKRITEIMLESGQSPYTQMIGDYLQQMGTGQGRTGQGGGEHPGEDLAGDYLDDLIIETR